MDAVEEDPFRGGVLRTARHRARIASDASLQINHHSILWLLFSIFVSVELSDLHPGPHIDRSAERIHAHVILRRHEGIEGRTFLGTDSYGLSPPVAGGDADHFRVNEFGQLRLALGFSVPGLHLHPIPS